MKDTHRAARSERGASSIETALILPVMLALMFGIIEFSRFFWIQHTVSAAAAEGARLAILNEPTDTEVYAWIDQIVMDGGVYDAAEVNMSARVAGQPVSVSVTVPYEPLVLPGFLSEVVMPAAVTSTATMECEP